MFKRINALILMMTVFSVSGCAQMNSQFDCPMKAGVRCESLDQVNARVDRGELGQDYTVSSKNNDSDVHFYKVQTRSSADHLRTRDTVLHVWIAPFEDADGNYHTESSVYTVSQSGYWINHPPKALTPDEE